MMPFKYGRRQGMVDGIKVILDLNYSNRMSFSQRILVFLKYALVTCYIAVTEKCDLIFCTSTPLTACLPGLVGKLVRRRRFVFEVRDLWPELPKAMGIITNPMILWLLKKLELMAYKMSDHIIGLSPGIIQGIVQNGIDTCRVTLIPNGCDFNQFSNSKGAASDIDRKSFVAIFSGTHGRANGLKHVLFAAEVLKVRKRNDIEIILIGDGSEKDSLQSLAQLRGLDNVKFLNPIPKHQLSKLFSEVDVGLQVLENIPAFYYGTSPNKFFDYLASGLPVITNYPGWVADLITENHCGIAVPPDDPVKLANAMMQLADDRRILPILSKNATKLGREKFDRQKLAVEFIKAITRA